MIGMDARRRPCGAAAQERDASADQPDQHPKRGFRVANIKSQIKRNKQNEKARQRNKAVKSSLKTSVRRFREAADAGDTDAAVLAMRDACRGLDKAASKGVIHKNQAANRKSAMAKRAAELQS
jgi:small subunit ribosomal protein S20